MELLAAGPALPVVVSWGLNQRAGDLWATLQIIENGTQGAAQGGDRMRDTQQRARVPSPGLSGRTPSGTHRHPWRRVTWLV